MLSSVVSTESRDIGSCPTQPNATHPQSNRLHGQARQGARAADDADHLVGLDVEAEVVQHLRRVRAVAEGHRLERDAALDLGQRALPRLARRLGRGVEYVVETRQRGAELLEILPALRQADDRLVDLAREHIEGGQLAHRQRPFDDLLDAEPEHQGIEGQRRKHDVSQHRDEMVHHHKEDHFRPLARALDQRRLAVPFANDELAAVVRFGDGGKAEFLKPYCFGAATPGAQRQRLSGAQIALMLRREKTTC